MSEQKSSSSKRIEKSRVKVRLLNLLEDHTLDMGFLCALAGDRPLTQEESDKFQVLLQEQGDSLYSEMLFVLVHEMFDADKAKEIWEDILKHKFEMSALLNRNVGLAVSATDYLSNIKGFIQNPSLISKKGMKIVADVALRDSLTGLFDHFTFTQKLELEAKRSERYNTPLSLLFMDIDDFKLLNDTYGHPKGDEILSRVGALIQEEVRDIDIAARYGGEEFTILLPHANHEEANTIAERIRLRVASEAFFDEFDNKICVTISLGVSSSPRSGTGAKVLLEKADQALYRSKNSGKNRTTLDIDTIT